MASRGELGEVVTTDVLIIGGGVGGLAAAVAAKEECPQLDVLVVEKQTAGWAGKGAEIGGILTFLGPNDDADRFMDFQVRTAGAYLNDQSALSRYVNSTPGTIETLGKWGARLARTPDGTVVGVPAFWAPDYTLGFIDIDLMLPIRARARRLGTRIMNKIHVVDLLVEHDRVVGAVGFDMLQGRFHVFKAKATILANGSCGYKVRRFWVAGTGDGIAAAFRAGAEMRNAEFGNLYGHTVYQDTDSGLVPFEYLVNARGENLVEKYLPGSGPAGVFLPIELAVGIDKEAAEGRAPFYFAPPESAPELPPIDLPKLSEWMGRLAAKERMYGAPPEARREIGVPLHGETSCIKVDTDMRTTVEGLWAIGDTSYAGSAVAGAVPSPPGVAPGSGIMFALVSASWGGPSAARFAAETPAAEVGHDQVKRLRDEAFAPLQRSNGPSPKEAVSILQDVTAPMRYSLRRSGPRLEEALDRLESVKEMLPELQAADPHYLAACHEVKSMTLCAELTLRAALLRNESRGFHFREDYPALDNEHWLKWVILKRDGDGIGISTRPVPIGDYGVRPD